jgi:hypothetical protein
MRNSSALHMNNNLYLIIYHSCSFSFSFSFTFTFGFVHTHTHTHITHILTNTQKTLFLSLSLSIFIDLWYLFSFQVLYKGLDQKLIKYLAFDYSTICEKKAKNVCQLIEEVKDCIRDFGWYFERGETRTLQSGVFRTNCLDCIERYSFISFTLHYHSSSISYFISKMRD